MHSHSAGTGGWHAGEEMNPPAARQVRARGGSDDGFTARKLRGDFIDEADLILTATADQYDYVVALRPDAAARTFVLGELGRLLVGVDPAALPSAEPKPDAVHARGALSRLGRTLWGDNPAASGDETFDRQFQILTKDPDLARSLIAPALIAEHVAGRVPEWSLTGSDLLPWQPGHIDDPPRIPMLVSPLLRVAQLLGR